MTQTTLESSPQETLTTEKPKRRFLHNPVIRKELSSRMRGLRSFIILTVYLLIVSGIVSLVYFSFISSNSVSYDPNTRQEIGKIIFAVVLALQVALINFVSPALTAGAIAAERERQTYDLLRTTLLTARSLVSGKLVAALLFLLLLMLAALPLQSIAFIFGGIELPEFLVSTLLLLLTTITYSTIGIFFSSFIKRTLPATVLAYLVPNLIMFGIPILIFLLILLYDSVPYDLAGNIDDAIEIAVFAIGWVLVSLHPIAAAIVAEIILIEEQSLFYTTTSVGSISNFPVISPWISFSIIYILVSLLLYLLSVMIVGRKEK